MAEAPGEFLFEQPKNLGVLVCDHVWDRGKPILYVSHDDGGDWQFLCGELHDDGSSKPVLVSLESVVARDPSLNEVADLAINHWAERSGPRKAWKVVDQTEDDIRHAVGLRGFFVALFDGGELASQLFAYSIGLNKTVGHPEVLMLGQPLVVMEKVLSELGDRLKAGVRYHPEEKIFGLLDAPCVLRPLHPTWLGEYVGYGLWYYGHPFEALQLVWADSDGCFPHEDEDCSSSAVDAQPDLRAPAK